MKYYVHSVDTMEDEKVSELFKEFGYEGTGLFHAILEKLARQEKPIKTDVLKYQLKVGKKLNKCWEFMESIGLISSNNGETFNKQLLNFSEKYQIKKEKTAKKVAEWREKQAIKENVTDYENNCNASKVNESKVKEICIYTFDKFYDYQVNDVAKKFVEENPEARKLALGYYDFVCWLFNHGKFIKKDLLGKVESEKKKNLLSMTSQLTFGEFASLSDKCEKAGVNLMQVFEAMENYKLLSKKGKTIKGMAETFIRNETK